MTFKQASREMSEALAVEHQALGALLKGLDEGMSQVALQILRDAAQKAYGEARRAHDRAKHMYEQEMHDARETA